MGHPAYCNLENRNSQAKIRDNKSKEQGHYKSSDNMKNVAKMTAFQQIQLVWAITKTSFQIRIEFDAQLTEFTTEEHHEEREGKNTLWALSFIS